MKKFLKGMFKDSERVDQLDGTYRDALNANINYIKGAICNEQGNESTSLDQDIKYIIGECSDESGLIYVFGIKEYNNEEYSFIGVLYPKEKIFTVLYASKELNFQRNYTIEATVKVNSKGDTILYFTDNYIKRSTNPQTGIEYVEEYNPPRAFNVTRQLRNLFLPESIFLLYNSEEYSINKLNLFMTAGQIPMFNDVLIKEGGGVVSGTYHLALAYSDEDGNATNYILTSNAVHIVTARENAVPTETITGDPQGSQTNKSIYWEIEIPDKCDYSNLRPVVIQRFGGQNQESSEFAYQLQDVTIPQYTGVPRTVTISYSGLETVAQSSVAEVVIDSVAYQCAKTLCQLDNTLYVGNLQSRGDIGYQRFANNIKLDAVVESVDKFDPRRFTWESLNFGYSFFEKENLFDELNFRRQLYPDQINEDGTVRKGYKDSKLFYKKKSFRRSEVYAFYISFVLKDGTETYAYHIPGREAKELVRIKAGIYENDSIISNGNPYVDDLVDTYKGAKYYQLFDTDLYFDNVTTGYWENQNERYPVSSEFDVFNVENDGTPVQIGSIRNQNVRHHKMPSNKKDAFGFIGKQTGTGAETFFSPRIDESINYQNDFTMLETVNLLGIKLSNIKIPKFILGQVQGYKIYYAKRTQENKTIIGQSVPVPAWLLNNTVPTMNLERAKTGPFYKAWMMYGGIPETTNAYPLYSQTTNVRHNINVFPVFGFHDFNLLKNKHTLTGATHINVQHLMVMRHYKGGPRVKAPLTEGQDAFYNVDWVNTDIGNTFDPTYTGTDNIPPDLRIKAFRTSAMLAAAYYNPNNVPDNIYSKYERITNSDASTLNTFSNLIDDFYSVLGVKSNSTTYVNNNINIKTTDGGEFHGVDYIYNAAGESKAVIGLSIGLPMLVGYLNNTNGGWLQDEDPEDTDTSARFSWYSPNGYLSLASNPQSSPIWYNDFESLLPTKPFLETQLSSQVKVGGLPVTYLINLCSLKSDVFNSFDEQLLVSTGYYQPINADLTTGISDNVNYYQGAESDNIFGGDTYIGRYGFRSTNHTYGNSYNGFQVSPNLTNTSVFGSVPGTRGNNTPTSTLFYFMCESDDLLGYRHIGDSLQGVTADKSLFFDAATAHAVIFNSPINDNTHMDNLLYMNNYSLNQDIRVTTPLPKFLNNVTRFPNRTIRSLNDEGSVSDKYRVFQALEYKDITKHRGEVWKLFSIGSILYIHTERSLFVTKGDQEIQLSDNSQAFVGSGNIFAIDPDEMITTTDGYGGCDSQFSSITTRYGHFYVNRKDKKVYIVGEDIEEVSSIGMEKWFIDNLPYQIETLLNINLDFYEKWVVNSDSPTSDFGITVGYDPSYKRVLITKRERIPNQRFLNKWNLGIITRGKFRYSEVFYEGNTPIRLDNDYYFETKAWTVSYYPELKVWGSRHTYTPVLFSNNNDYLYSIINENELSIWEHSSFNAPCTFFTKTDNFEFEYIDNESGGTSKVFSAINYWADVTKVEQTNPETYKYISPGFDEFYVYNTNQISGTPKEILYLSNARLVDKFWYINDFRDMSLNLSLDYLNQSQIDVQGNVITTPVGPSFAHKMFTSEGVVNPAYININKSWFEQKRFVDQYLGIRLISNNNDQNLISLYAAGTKNRQSHR